MYQILLALTLVAASPLNADDVTAPAAGTDSTENSPVMTPIANLPIVTVTASRYASDPLHSPQLQSTVLRADLLRRPADQTPNLLANEPGVLVQKTNYGGGSPFIHGLTGKQILLLVDGVRMNNSLYRFGPHQYLNTIDPYAIESIEVVHGPSSVLYGTDALGGTINVLTRRPVRYSDEAAYGIGTGAGGASSDRSVRGRMAYHGYAEGQGVHVGATAKSFGDVRGGDSIGRQAHTGYDEFSADMKYVRELTSNMTLWLASQLHRQFDVPKTSEMTLDGKLAYNYEPQLRALNYAQLRGLTPDRAILDEYAFSLSYQYHGEGEYVQVDAASDATEERNNAHTLGTYVQAIKRIQNRHAVAVGAEYYVDLIDSSKLTLTPGNPTNAKPAFPDGARYHSAGVYVQGDWRPHERIRLVAGERFSVFSANGVLPDPAGTDIELDLLAHDFTGSFGADARLIEGLHASAQVAQGFRAPNMEDFFGKVDFASEIPNEKLAPEKSIDFQTGLKYRDHRLSGQVFYFRDEFFDLIDRADVEADMDGDGELETVAQRQNVGRARIQGASVGLNAKPIDWLDIRTTYAYTIGDKLAAGIKVEPLRRMPPQHGSLSLRFLTPRKFFVMPEIVWAADQNRLAAGDISDKRIGPNGTDGYAVLHVRTGAELYEGGHLAFGLENVFDAAYKSHGSGVYFPGRNLYLQFAHRL